jgi:hypothetical protein
MNCLEFRRRTGAEPALATPEILGHRAACPACARFQDQMRALDLDIGRALAVDAAALARPREATGGGATPRPAPRWYALAASLVLGVALAAALWVSFPAPTVAAEVLEHVRHEPYAWSADAPLAADAVEGVLRGAGVRLREDSGPVTYAENCWHERHWVPHLVVLTPEGPVTVLLLSHREVAAPVAVADDEFTGVVLPAPRGSIAIVGRGIADIDAVAQQVFLAVEWDA